MRVLLITSEGACGIAAHSEYLVESVYAADTSITITQHTDLHPSSVPGTGYELIWLNYQAGLHSQWTPEWVHHFKAAGVRVGITYHDTGVPNSEQCRALHAVADAFVVHEPCDDLPGAHYWRQGVPDWQRPHSPGWGVNRADGRPWLGTMGFPFPWKNYDLLCEATQQAGWNLLLLAPNATPEQQTRWQQLNPRVTGNTAFLPREEVVSTLGECDATAWAYNNCNTGTSGAIRQGIAARKPVIASRFPFGRQFRDLHADPLAKRVITWIEPNLEGLVRALSEVRVAPVDAGMVALAQQDSWEGLGRKYAALYKELVHGRA